MDLLSPVWSRLTPLQPARGEGAYLFEEDGTRWTDFTSGIGVTNTGHCHPRVVEAVKAQADKLLFGQINIVKSPLATQLAERLDAVTPGGIDSFFFSNSGAEAVEGAVKLARHATGRPNVVVFQGGFHGRTAQAMALTTAKTVYRHRYYPLPSGVYVAPFPYPFQFRSDHGWDEGETVAFCIRQLALLLKGQTAPDETAALLIEPVLGEGGYVPAPPAFLHALREICDRYGILLILDEVQSGFGRTGAMFYADRAEVEPDILVMAKGLASGLPLSAVGSRRDLMAKWEPGTHGGTYGGGSAVALAAAVATVDVIEDEELPANAARQGARLTAGLRDLQEEFQAIGEVRGPGLMVGVEFVRDGGPSKDLAHAVQKACLEERLILLTCGTNENVIRWIPPLVASERQIDDAVAVFGRAVATVTAKAKPVSA